MNTVANIFLPTPVTADDINQFIEAAANEYRNAKSSAMQSAANAYLVWHHGESDNALPDMRAWLDGRIDELNTAIKAHNLSVENVKDRAKRCADGSINDPLSENEKAELLKMHTRSREEWAKEKQVTIEGRNGASNYTRIVKFVFGFIKPGDASHVSRYAKVLEFIEQRKHELNGDFAVEAIVKLLNKAGGFEAAIEAMRGNASAVSDNVRGATLQKIKQVVGEISSGDEIAFTPKHSSDGYVFLVGRTTATGVMVCGELAINDNEADDLLLKLDSEVIGDPAPTVDFVGRVISIGQLVSEGRDSHITDTAGTGKKFKTTRAYSLLRHGGSTQMIVSARYAETSLVVQAYPKGNVTIGILEQGQAAMLDAQAATTVSKQFGDPALRLLMSLDAMQGDSAEPVNWSVSTDTGEKPKQASFEWKSMYGQSHLPLNMRGYDPGCTITLTHAQMRDLYENYLRDWGKNKKDDKDVKKPLTVEFDGLIFVVKHEAFDQHVMPVGDKQGAHVSLTMRPRDIVDLFKKLIDLNVQHCALSGDTNGMLAASWDDAVGDYLVYIPAVEPRGSLNKACLGYIKPSK